VVTNVAASMTYSPQDVENQFKEVVRAALSDDFSNIQDLIQQTPCIVELMEGINATVQNPPLSMNGTTICVSSPDSDEWLKDPCCNDKLDQCCKPRNVQVSSQSVVQMKPSFGSCHIDVKPLLNNLIRPNGRAICDSNPVSQFMMTKNGEIGQIIDTCSQNGQANAAAFIQCISDLGTVGSFLKSSIIEALNKSQSIQDKELISEFSKVALKGLCINEQTGETKQDINSIKACADSNELYCPYAEGCSEEAKCIACSKDSCKVMKSMPQELCGKSMICNGTIISKDDECEIFTCTVKCAGCNKEDICVKASGFCEGFSGVDVCAVPIIDSVCPKVCNRDDRMSLCLCPKDYKVEQAYDVTKNQFTFKPPTANTNTMCPGMWQLLNPTDENSCSSYKSCRGPNGENATPDQCSCKLLFLHVVNNSVKVRDLLLTQCFDGLCLNGFETNQCN